MGGGGCVGYLEVDKPTVLVPIESVKLLNFFSDDFIITSKSTAWIIIEQPRDSRNPKVQRRSLILQNIEGFIYENLW